MNKLALLAAAAALVAATGTVSAQASAPEGSAPAASAPRGATGTGRMGGHSGRNYTPGWSMMTRQERQEHQAKMGAMHSYDECKAYVEQHHQQMAQRAKDKGTSIPAQPRRDPCADLKR